MSTEVVTNSSLELKGAFSFRQYKINDKLITFIGEFHLSAYTDCTGSNYISVADYINEQVVDHKARVLLEYVATQEKLIPMLGSKNMADVYKALSDSGNAGKLTGFDIRSTLIRKVDQYALYHKDLSKLSERNVLLIFLNPIAGDGKMNRAFRLDPTKFNDSSPYIFLQSAYVDDMKAHAESMRESIETGGWKVTKIRNQIIDGLKHLWKKVADFAVVKDVFMNRSKHLIILGGEEHAKNFEKVFLNSKIFESVASKTDQCISIEGSKNV